MKKPEFNRDPFFQQFASIIPLKRAVMTAEPSILMRKLEHHDLFLIFASDGLWEQLSDQEAVEIVLKSPRVVSHQQIFVIRFEVCLLSSNSSCFHVLV